MSQNGTLHLTKLWSKTETGEMNHRVKQNLAESSTFKSSRRSTQRDDHAFPLNCGQTCAFEIEQFRKAVTKRLTTMLLFVTKSLRHSSPCCAALQDEYTVTNTSFRRRHFEYCMGQPTRQSHVALASKARWQPKRSHCAFQPLIHEKKGVCQGQPTQKYDGPNRLEPRTRRT